MTIAKGTFDSSGLPRPNLEAVENGRGSPHFLPDETEQHPPQPSPPPDESLQLLTLDPIQFRALLHNLAVSAGSMAELARRAGVTGQFLGDIISGRKRPGPKLLSALGELGVSVTVETVYRVTVATSMEGDE